MLVVIKKQKKKEKKHKHKHKNLWSNDRVFLQWEIFFQFFSLCFTLAALYLSERACLPMNDFYYLQLRRLTSLCVPLLFAKATDSLQLFAKIVESYHRMTNKLGKLFISN